MPKSIDQLRKEVKGLEKSKKERDERMKLEAKLKALKSPSRIHKVIKSERTKKFGRGVRSAFDRAGSNFGF